MQEGSRIMDLSNFSLWAWMVMEPLSLNVHLPRSLTFLMFMRSKVHKAVPLIFVGEIAVDIL